MRYTDKELSLIKNTFAEQTELLVLIRKFLLQGEMSTQETSLLKKTVNPDVYGILIKSLNPSIDKLASEFENIDMFSSLDVSPTPVEHAYLSIKVRHRAKQYLDERFTELQGKKVTDPIIFDEMHLVQKNMEETYINFVARNFLLTHIETQLFHKLKIIAGTKEETPEEAKERLTRASNK